MKKYLILALFFLSSCSGLISNCNQEKDWSSEGKNSVNSGLSTDEAIASIQNLCEDPISPASIAEFERGVKLQKEINCTGSNALSQTGWSELGHTVALRGDTLDSYKSFKEKCGLIPTTQELRDYTSGFNQSLAELCTQLGGMEFARLGHTYKSTCPKNIEMRFFKGQKVGLKMKEIDDLNIVIKNQNQLIEQLQKETLEHERTVVLCSERLIKGKEGAEINDRTSHDCYTSDADMAQLYKGISHRKIHENKLKLVELKNALETSKDTLQLKYKEVEIIRSMLDK